MKFLPAVKDWCEPFQNISRFQTISIKFRKILQERRQPISKFLQENPQNNFLNFLTSKNVIKTLQYSRDILGIFLKQIFVEYSSNILEALLRDYWILPKDQHLLLSNHTLLTQKQLFHRELFQKIFSFKMFPGCYENCNAKRTLSEYSRNIACRLGSIRLVIALAFLNSPDGKKKSWMNWGTNLNSKIRCSITKSPLKLSW